MVHKGFFIYVYIYIYVFQASARKWPAEHCPEFPGSPAVDHVLLLCRQEAASAAEKSYQLVKRARKGPLRWPCPVDLV